MVPDAGETLMAWPKGKPRSLPLYPWHVRVLRLLLRHGPLTTGEIGDRLYTTTPAEKRPGVALHELLELQDCGLVDRDHGRPERWHPALFAGEALRTAGAPRAARVPAAAPDHPPRAAAPAWPSIGARDLAERRT
jgi:hypothetical protein